eukprot:Partr_v1_DN25192_c0_g1_i1_m76586 putative 2-phosphoglycerate kinase-related
MNRLNGFRMRDILQFFCKEKHVDSLAERLLAISSSGNEQDLIDNQLSEALQDLNYSPQLFHIAREIKCRRRAVVIMLGGTSGCGKSTLGSLLASKLGINTVISTDHIRQLLRAFIDDPGHVLFSSSYSSSCSIASGTGSDESVIAGFEEQCRLIYPHLEVLIRHHSRTNQCLIVEGVHLSAEVMHRLIASNLSSSCQLFPFVLYISNRVKHCERFAIRAKYMTLQPCKNKYIRHFDSIRAIQSHLCSVSEQLKLPKIDNTNVDKSIVLIHQTILRQLSTFNNGSLELDNYLRNLDAAFEETIHSSNHTSSKDMLRYLQERQAAKHPLTGNAIERQQEERIFDGFPSHDTALAA